MPPHFLKTLAHSCKTLAHSDKAKTAKKASPVPGGLIELQNPSLGITLTGAIEISRFGLTPQPPICIYYAIYTNVNPCISMHGVV